MKKLVALFAAIMIMASGALFTVDASQSYGYEESADVWAPDYSEYEAMSIRSLENLVDDGDGFAAFELACRYIQIDDFDTSLEYLSLASDLGNPDAMYVLARTYFENVDVEDMDEESFISTMLLLETAADMGQQEAYEMYYTLLEALGEE